MTSIATPRLILMAQPPPSWIESTFARLVGLGAIRPLANRLFRPELWHQSFSERIFDPSPQDRDALLRVCAGLSARACTLHFNRVEGPDAASGRTHCTLRARGVPKPFADLRQTVRQHLQHSGFASIATGVTPHMTLSYNARTSFANIPIDPPIPWTIDAVCLVLGGGDPYGYEVIGRWALLPEQAPPATQPALF